MMKIINLNSNVELTMAQISFVESIIACGDDKPLRDDDSISFLMNEIPIFLIDKRTQEEYSNGDLLGFYQHSSRILGTNTPVIGLCLEKIIDQVKSEEELIILIAKVIIHEFAHAKLSLDPRANYHPIDEFYLWMEEPMANLITLEYFRSFKYCHRRNRRYGISPAYKKTTILPFDFVKDYISKQPDNYRLGLDLFEKRIWYWWIWRNSKNEIQKKTKEKNDWLNYVKSNVGKTDEKILEKLFEALYK